MVHLSHLLLNIVEDVSNVCQLVMLRILPWWVGGHISDMEAPTNSSCQICKKIKKVYLKILKNIIVQTNNIYIRAVTSHNY